MEKNSLIIGDIYIFPEWENGLGMVCPVNKGKFSRTLTGKEPYLLFIDGWADYETLVEDGEAFYIRIQENEIDAYKMIYPDINWQHLEKLTEEIEG